MQSIFDILSTEHRDSFVIVRNNNSNNENNNEQKHSSSSRHIIDFDIIKCIGIGGYGNVYLVKNKLDLKLYALKCVRIYNKERELILREVKLLSTIQYHENIIRYYSAWIELQGIDDENNSNDTDDDEDDGINNSSSYSAWTNNNNSVETDEDYTNNNNNNENSSSSSSSSSKDEAATNINNSYPVCNLCKSTYNDWQVSFEHWLLIDQILHPLNLCTECYINSIPKNVDRSQIHIHEVPPMTEKIHNKHKQSTTKEYLYILMEYCECTLLQALNNNNTWYLFYQCVLGLAYLHESGMLHRDVKPNNIFIKDGNIVKIGDLGLATTTTATTTEAAEIFISDDDNIGNRNEGTKNDNNDNNNDTSNSKKSSQVGTYLYTAPEVKTGIYDEKCDIYSLGIVLVEMFANFTTGMERIQTLTSLHSNTEIIIKLFPEHPFVVTLAQQMLQHDPLKRPSCQEIIRLIDEENCNNNLFFHNNNYYHHHSSSNNSLRLSNRSLSNNSYRSIIKYENGEEKTNTVEVLQKRIIRLETELTEKSALVEKYRSLLIENGISFE